MQYDAELRGLDTRPNTVTYNSILATLTSGDIGKENVKSEYFDQLIYDEVLLKRVTKKHHNSSCYIKLYQIAFLRREWYSLHFPSPNPIPNIHLHFQYLFEYNQTCLMLCASENLLQIQTI